LLLVLQQLGLTYDLLYSEDFTSIDYTPYHTVIVGMNGGYIKTASCQARATAAPPGALTPMVGGSPTDPAAQRRPTALIPPSPPPPLGVVDPPDAPAAGLPAPYTYNDFGASFYMLRIAAPAATVATQNGDNHPTLVHKSVGAGTLVYFTSPASDYFWYDPSD